ncbi:hypothetical protein JIX56_19445 [Streptomyces sp. CA-210063]|nr:hypothetical protein [Streptomyces sp. CA-210063]UUU31900.1 hypothetical protein JIX56_19445 [Streptomyces sp. CA-210063]
MVDVTCPSVLGLLSFRAPLRLPVPDKAHDWMNSQIRPESKY